VEREISIKKEYKQYSQAQREEKVSQPCGKKPVKTGEAQKCM
jgi:hypothetical protein